MIFVGCSFIGLQAQTDSIKARLDSLMQDPLLERTQLGLMVYDLTADSTIYTYGAKQTLRPASTMKLLTAVTALDQLGGDYQSQADKAGSFGYSAGRRKRDRSASS